MIVLCSSVLLAGIRQATDDALSSLQRLREGSKRKMMTDIFSKKSKKVKLCAWKHNFCCLARRDQQRSPTTESEREELYRAGLGFKDIVFNDIYINKEEFHESILENFPRLRYGGGFRFLKGWCVSINESQIRQYNLFVGVQANRDLEVLSITVHKSPMHLKERVGNFRIYLRPLQCDLDTTPLSVVCEDLVSIITKCFCSSQLSGLNRTYSRYLYLSLRNLAWSVGLS